MGINDYGGTGDALNSPPLGGPGGWAEAVSAVVDGDDTTVDARIATHSADTTNVHGIPDTANLTTTAELEAYAAARATVGNILTDNQASGTDTTGAVNEWTSFSSPTFSSQSGSTSQGSKFLRAVSTSTAGTDYYVKPSADGDYYWPVNVPASWIGKAMTLTFDVRQTVGSRTTQARLIFLDDGAVLSSAGSTIITPGATYATQTVTVVVPVGANRARVAVTLSAGSIGDTLEMDRFGLWAGAGGDWSMPGTPITGLGTRISRPNVEDRLVEQWNGSAWSVVDYDSGARNYTASSAGTLRRSGRAVTWTGTGALPTGFRDTYAVGGQFFMTNDGTPTSLPGTLDTPAPQ